MRFRPSYICTHACKQKASSQNLIKPMRSERASGVPPPGTFFLSDYRAACMRNRSLKHQLSYQRQTLKDWPLNRRTYGLGKGSQDIEIEEVEIQPRRRRAPVYIPRDKRARDVLPRASIHSKVCILPSCPSREVHGWAESQPWRTTLSNLGKSATVYL